MISDYDDVVFVFSFFREGFGKYVGGFFILLFIWLYIYSLYIYVFIYWFSRYFFSWWERREVWFMVVVFERLYLRIDGEIRVYIRVFVYVLILR